MASVIEIRPGATANQRPSSETEIEGALSDARDLLSAAIQSIRDGDGEADACHRVAVERVKELLCAACESGSAQICHGALDALSLVELARMAMVVEPQTFNSCRGKIVLGLAIAEALEAAYECIVADIYEDDPEAVSAAG